MKLCKTERINRKKVSFFPANVDNYLKNNRIKKRPTSIKKWTSACIYRLVYVRRISVYETLLLSGYEAVKQRLDMLPLLRFTLIAGTALVYVLIIVAIVEEHFVQCR